MVSRRGRAAQVGTYLGPRAFYKKDMENKARVGQAEKALPPRCLHCRRSWDIVMIHDAPHCEEHYKNCDCIDSD